MARPNWSRKLPKPLNIPTVMTLTTLADIRELVERHLPAECRARHTWRHVANELHQAAQGGDIRDAVTALRLVLQLEGVPRRPVGNSRLLKLTRSEIRLLKDLIGPSRRRTHSPARSPSSIEVAHLIRAQYIVKLPPNRAVAKQYAVTQRGRQALAELMAM